MKKNNNRGFVLAETLIVTVFLLVIFSMLYSNFYPLIGEYEKRESYDDIDSKYAVYWLRKLIEDRSYVPPNEKKTSYRNANQFMRFECTDITDTEKRAMCVNLVLEFEIDGCDINGQRCEIFITPYQIANFKNTVSDKSVKRFKEGCSSADSTCRTNYVNKCISEDNSDLPIKTKEKKCQVKANKSIFDTAMEDYIVVLPDYNTPSPNFADSRIIARFHHRKDSNSYYSYATIEVNR